MKSLITAFITSIALTSFVQAQEAPPDSEPDSTSAPASEDGGSSSALSLGPSARPSTWQRTLANGLRVVGRHDPTITTAAVCVQYAVGSRDDPDGREGLAHFTEHLMFAPTERMPRGFAWLVERAGATYVQGTTRSDRTEYCTWLPFDALDIALFGESERMAYRLQDLNEGHVTRERRVLLQEAAQRNRGGFFMTLYRRPLRALYEGTAHARAFHDQSDVEELELLDVQRFFLRYYVPANAVLSIVSPEGAEGTMGRVRRYFDHIEGGPAPERNRQERTHLEGRVRVQLLSEAEDQHIRFIWPTMPFRTRGDAALDYLAIHLKRRLARRLVGLSGFRSFDARQRSDPYHSTFTIWLTTRGRSDLQRLENLIDEELRRVQERGLSPREFQRVQRSAQRYQRSRSPVDWAQSLADASGARRAPWTLEDERNRYESVRIEDVRSIANEFLPLDRRVEFRTRRVRTETPEGEWSVERAR